MADRNMEFGREGYGGPYGRQRHGAREWSSTEGWRVPGPGTGSVDGREPSDDRICKELQERLTAHTRIDAGNIDCQVVNGEVTLTGFVSDRAARRAANDVAEDTCGVRQVNNRLHVRPTTQRRPEIESEPPQ
jgi:osmotically-inducible protein OsmY